MSQSGLEREPGGEEAGGILTPTAEPTPQVKCPARGWEVWEKVAVFRRFSPPSAAP